MENHSKKIYHPTPGDCQPFYAGCVPAQARRGIHRINQSMVLVGNANHRNHCYRHQSFSQNVEKKPLGMNAQNSIKKKLRGRPRTQGNIRAFPVFREKPDVAKLGRAVIAMTQALTKDNDGRQENEN